MAKKFNENYEEQIKKARRDVAMLQEERKRKHTHKPNQGGKIMPLHDSRINVPGKANLPESTVICTNCECYFEGNAYLPSETDSGLYMFKSMIEQIKLNANLTDEDLEQIERYYDAIDELTTMANYYNDMVDKLANNGGKKNKNTNRPKKGYMGISPNMFGGRNY